MSWKKGGQWKSAWNRQRAYAGGQLVNMWFFDFGNGRYATALAAPFPFQSATFWMGLVTRATGNLTMNVRQLAAGPTGIVYNTNYGFDATGVTFVSSSTIENFTPVPPELLSVPQSQYLPAAGLPDGRVVVCLVTVNPENGQSRVNFWVDGALRQTALLTAFTAVAAVAELQETGTGAVFNGFAGGASLPTDAEINQWFADVRTNADIQSIPGKTTDLVSASSVAPAAPAVLPNGGGGQVFTQTVGVSANTQLASYFSY